MNTLCVRTVYIELSSLLDQWFDIAFSGIILYEYLLIPLHFDPIKLNTE